MQFTKLRLHGFKSFVESTELLIEPGLTGIVGPNGCGKSNLVEALQWVMGESSARRLRGGDMDDVIFGGTASRPGRSLASVTLSLDNRARTVAPDIANADELEIDRRIDRGKGSTYRVNGREVRARDVQLLFADAASGAQSVSLIGQGRIGWLINARPAERRLLLEEAAGIGGLQARRHEAELKLSAAEANLVRLGDVETGLVQQIDRLKKQARQAERYRRLSEQLRLAEALLIHRHWLDQRRRVAETADRLQDAAGRVAAAQARVETADRVRFEAQAALPALRERAGATAREVDRLGGLLVALDADSARVAGTIEELGRRRLQIEQDGTREAAFARDAEAALARLEAESAALRAEQAAEAADRTACEHSLAAAQTALAEAEAGLAAATSRAAAGEAARLAVEKRQVALEERRRRLARQTEEAKARSREIDLLAVPSDRLDEAAAAVAAAESAADSARQALELAGQALLQADQARQAARQPVAATERSAIGLRAEIAALRAVLRSAPGQGVAPLLDGIAVSDGLEAALGAALGDDLFAATDPRAAVHWTQLPPLEAAALPAGSTALAVSVRAPPLLQRRLAAIGLVPDEATGGALQAELRPGQRLVSRDGAVWRWDGLTIAAGTETAAAVRLAQRSRLERIEAESRDAEDRFAAAGAAERLAAAALEAAREAERAARTGQLQAAQRLLQTRQAQQALVQQHGQADARRQAAGELAQRLATEAEELAAQAAETERDRASLPETGEARRAVERQRDAVARAREAEATARRQLDMLARDSTLRLRRQDAITAEATAWRQRAAGAAAQAAVLAERRRALEAEQAALADRPAALAAERRTTETALSDRRADRLAAAAVLTRAETAADEAANRHSEGVRDLGEAREARVRAEATHEQAEEAEATTRQRVTDQFGCPPAELPAVFGLAPDLPDEPTDAAEARVERLRRDREAIGPVNLMAESELAELDTELATIRAESADLTEAIARLRQAIRELNREGRQRLATAFEAVNGHFQALFTRLFGGGRAYLELSGGDGDPLAAGLEIMASPPGKKLQALSLLSGGERALTALALVFAVFLTNPAPVCVLDEVDAPLDDANVERFCALVSEIAERAETRFLIVTHHRVTMARMDRLYGVTMVERGISRLVSVELNSAEQMRRTA